MGMRHVGRQDQKGTGEEVFKTPEQTDLAQSLTSFIMADTESTASPEAVAAAHRGLARGVDSSVKKNAPLLSRDAFKPRKQEGLMESTFVTGFHGVNKLFSKLAGGEAKEAAEEKLEEKGVGEYKAYDKQKANELDSLDYSKVRQTVISPYLRTQLYIDKATQDLGNFDQAVADSIVKSTALGGHDVTGTKNIAQRTFGNAQQVLDSMLPAEVSGGIMRRLFQGKDYEMPVDFMFDDGVELHIQKVMEDANKSGQAITFDRFGSNVKIHPGMDKDTARELIYNNYVVRARNDATYVSTDGNLQDISAVVQLIASAGAMTLTKAGGEAAKQAIKRGMLPNTFAAITQNPLNSLFRKPMQGLPGWAKPLGEWGADVAAGAIYTGALSAIASPGDTMQYGLTGAMTGAFFPAARLPFALGGSFRNMFKPVVTASRVATPEMASGLSQTVNKVAVAMGLAGAGSMAAVASRLGKATGDTVEDPAVFTYIVDSLIKNPDVQKVVRNIHDFTHPNMSVNEVRHREALDGLLDQRHWAKIEELRQITHRTPEQEAQLKSMEQQFTNVKNNIDLLATKAHLDSPDLLNYAKTNPGTRSLWKPLERLLGSAVHSEEAYLQRVMVQTLSNPHFAFKDPNFKYGQMFNTLEMTDPISVAIKNTLSKGTQKGGIISLADKFRTRQAVYTQQMMSTLGQLSSDLTASGLSLSQVQTVMKRAEQQGVVLLPNNITDPKVIKSAIEANKMMATLRTANQRLVDEYDTIVQVSRQKTGAFSKVPKIQTDGMQVNSVAFMRNLSSVSDSLDLHLLPKDTALKVLESLKVLETHMADPRNFQMSNLPPNTLTYIKNSATLLDANYAKKFKRVIASRAPDRAVKMQQLKDQMYHSHRTARILRAIAEDVELVNADASLLRQLDPTVVTGLSTHAQVRNIAKLSSNVQSKWGKLETHHIRATHQPMLIGELQKDLNMSRDSAEMVYLWQTRDVHSFFKKIGEEVNKGKAEDAAILHVFTELDNSYGKMAHELVNQITQKIESQVGIKVSKEFIQGFFVRATDPVGLVKLLDTTTMSEEAKSTFLRSAMNSRKGRGSDTSFITQVGHSITAERAMETQTNMSVSGVMGNLQRDSILGGQDIADFQRLAPVKELMNELRAIGSNEWGHKIASLIDGVRGVQTILVKSEVVPGMTRASITANPANWANESLKASQPTATGKMLLHMVSGVNWTDLSMSTAGRIDSDAALKATAGDVAKYINSLSDLDYKALQRQVALEGKDRLGALPDNKSDQKMINDYALNFTSWAKGYFSSVIAGFPEASGNKIAEGMTNYRRFKQLDAMVSTWAKLGAEENSARYGYPLKVAPHRAHRPIGKIKDDLEYNKSINLAERSSGIGRYFGTDNNSQLARASTRTLQDSENLYTTIVRDSLLRISGARTQHAHDQAQAYLVKLNTLGFVNQAADFNKLLSANQIKMFVDNLTNQLSKFIYRVPGKVGKGAQYLHELTGAIGQMSGYLGRFTKPFIEGVQMTEMLLLNSNMYRTAPGRKAFFVGMASPWVNFFRQFGFMFKPMPKDGFLGQAAVRDGTSGLDAKVIQLENGLVNEYRQKVDVAFTKRLINKSLAGENAISPDTPFEKAMDKAYGFNNIIFTRTKELQETLGNRSGAQLGRVFFNHMLSEIEQGATLHKVYQTLKSSMELNTSEARLLQTTASLFDGIPNGPQARTAMLAKLDTPQGGKAYMDFCSIFIENSVGRYGALSGSKVSRWMSQINPSLALYFTPATMFVDRLITSRLAAVYGGQSPTGKLIHKVWKNAWFPAVAWTSWQMGKSLLESGTEGTDLPLVGDAINEFFHAELEGNPTMRAWVTQGVPFLDKFDRQGFGKATSIAPSFTYDLLTKKDGTRRAWEDLKTYPAKVLTGTTGNERGLGTLAGFDSALGVGIMAESIGVFNNAIRIRGAIEALRDNTLAGKLSYTEYVEKSKSLYERAISGVKNPTLKDKAIKEIKAGGILSVETLDLIDRDVELQIYEGIGSALDKSPLAAIAHAINPVVLVQSFRMLSRNDYEKIESAHWADTLQGRAAFMRAGKPYTAFEKFVGSVLEAYVAEGAITAKDVERYTEIADRMATKHYGPEWDNPNITTPFSP